MWYWCLVIIYSNFWKSTPSYKASKINFTNVRLETFWLFKAKHGKKLLVATDLQKFQKLNWVRFRSYTGKRVKENQRNPVWSFNRPKTKQFLDILEVEERLKGKAELEEFSRILDSVGFMIVLESQEGLRVEESYPQMYENRS